MNKNMSEESHKKIFISHSSKDKQIVDIFVDKLLHLAFSQKFFLKMFVD